MALANLKKIQRLSPALQNEIAGKVADFINLAGVASNESLLYDFLATAVQQRQAAIAAGATSVADARWAAAALSESTWKWTDKPQDRLVARRRQVDIGIRINHATAA